MTAQAEYRRWLHEQGRCSDCKQRDAYTMNGRWRCAICNEKVRQREAELRKAGRQEKENEAARKRNVERKESGLCIQCGKSTQGNGKVRCSHCLEINRRSASRKFRRQHPEVNLPRGDNGICYLCNKTPSVAGKRLCQTCHDLLAAQAVKLSPNRDNHIWNKYNLIDFRKAPKNH